MVIFTSSTKTLTQQHHHIIITLYTNTRHSLKNIITLSSLYTQTHDTNSTTSSHHPHFINKLTHLTTTSSLHPHLIHKNTWHSLNNIIIISSSLHTQTQDTHSTASSHPPHFIHKHMRLTKQQHHIILTS